MTKGCNQVHGLTKQTSNLPQQTKKQVNPWRNVVDLFFLITSVYEDFVRLDDG